MAEGGRTGVVVGRAAEKPDVIALPTLIPLETVTSRAVGIDNDATSGIATRATVALQWGGYWLLHVQGELTSVQRYVQDEITLV